MSEIESMKQLRIDLVERRQACTFCCNLELNLAIGRQSYIASCILQPLPLDWLVFGRYDQAAHLSKQLPLLGLILRSSIKRPDRSAMRKSDCSLSTDCHKLSTR